MASNVPEPRQVQAPHPSSTNKDTEATGKDGWRAIYHGEQPDLSAWLHWPWPQDEPPGKATSTSFATPA